MGRYRVKILLFVKFLLIFCLIAFSAKAQSGKISGVVTESASGDPLPGVSVYIADLAKGAVTNVDGEYTILSVPSGTYVVRYSFLGFSTVVLENVEVFSGQTTSLDVELLEEVFEGEELVITAERPIVQRDQTSSVSFVKKETIEELPVLEVADLVKFQPGVVTTNSGGFSFRGGRTREVAYIVDGIPVQNVYSQGGGNTIDVEVQSVQELQVLTGTFDAEIGGAQSGVVNVTTIDPAKELTGSLQFRSGGFYAGDNDIFIDGDAFDPVQSTDVSFTLSGPSGISKDLGFFLNGRYEDRVGHQKGIRRFTSDDGLVLDAYRFWYRTIYSPDDARLIPMDTARTPSGNLILDSSGNPLVFGSGDNSIVEMDWSKTYTVNPKLVYRFSNRTKVSLSAIYNNRESQGYSDSRRYAPDGRNIGESYSLTNILALKQTFSNNMVMNLRGSYKFSRSRSRAFDDFFDERYQYFSDSDPTTGFSLGATSNGRSRFEEDQIIASGDLTWQVNFITELKTGFQFRTNRFKSIDESIGWVDPADPGEPVDVVRPENVESFDFFDQYLAAVRAIQLDREISANLTGVSRVFEQQPIEFAYFLQNKMEFSNNVVVKTGLRYELYDTGERTILNTRQQSEFIGRNDNLGDASVKTYLSPRIGVSFPISDRGAFRVAYGHFVQMPAYNQIFQNPVDENTNQGRLDGTTIGNPDLDPERTVKYELGLQQQIADFMGVDFNFYYKNVRNLLGLEILNTSDGVQYFRTVNRDYGLIKGTTIAMYTKPMGYLRSAGIDLTYQDAQGSSSNPDAIADVIIAGRAGEAPTAVVDRQIIALDWDQTVSANAYISVGIDGNWNVGLVGQLATGQPYTPSFIDPTKDFPDNFFDNTEVKPLLVTLDLTAQKDIQLAGTTLNFKLQVNNLINYLNERTVDSISGASDQIVRLPEDQVERSFVNNFVGLFTDAEDNVRPTWYSAPRQILFSIQVDL
ncbi:MAG: TonB-dependent receptor [Balneolaceae bacterium]